MRVGVTTFGSDSGKSGVGQYIINLLRQFPVIAPDLEFEVILYRDEEEMYLNGVQGVSVHHASETFRPPTRNLLWHQFGLPRLCEQRGYDILFIPAGNRRLPYRMPCPTVANVLDLCALHIQGKYDRLHSFYNLSVLPRLIRRLTGVITLSESSKQDLVNYVGVPEDKVCVIPLAADLGHFYPRDRATAQDRVRNLYGVEPPYILYISRIEHPGKNHVRLIHAFEQAKASESLPHKLVIAGSDWTRADQVHQAAATCRFNRDIVFTGFASHPDLPDLYCAADAFFFPSLYEGFGMPILEAMACGTPVACSNISSLPEVAGDAAVLFDPCSVESIANALRRLLLDDAMRASLSQKGLARSQLYSWDNTARQTVNALRRFAARS